MVELQRVFHQSGPARAEKRGIENPHLDLRMDGKGNQFAVPREIEIIEQQADPNSAVGRFQEMFCQDAAGLVGIVDVILGIDRFLGSVGQGGAGDEGLEPELKDAKSRLAGMALLRGRQRLTEARGLRMFEGE